MNKKIRFTMPEDDQEHTVGDKYCDACWKPPETCQNCSEGLVHTSFMEEDYDNVFFFLKCDVCGDIP